LFVSAPAYNVIRREILKPNGISFHSHRPEQAGGQEFIASKDAWFRPTMLKTGPDGALWIADFYRLILEHPEWIPDDVEQKLNLRSGSDRGRLYRVYPTENAPRSIPKLSNKTQSELVATLDSPSGWQRDMAQRILVNQNDQSTVNHLEELLKKTKKPKTRLHILYTLEGINKVRPDHLIIGLTDVHPGVREHSIRIAEILFKRSQAGPIEEALKQLVNDPNVRVRTQLAFSLGEWKSPAAGSLLAKLAINCSDAPDIQIAIASSAKGHSVAILKEILNQSTDNSFSQLINNLLVLAGNEASKKELKQLLNNIISDTKKIAPWQVIAISDLIENSKKRGISNVDLAIGEELINSLDTITKNSDLEALNRAAALRLMANLINEPKHLNSILRKQLSAYSPNLLFDFALDRLSTTDPSIDALLEHWKSYSPNRRNRVLQHILNNEEKTIGLFQAIQNGQLQVSNISTAFQQLLKQHTNQTIKEQAKKYFGEQNTKRNQLVIERLPKVAKLKGNNSSGETIFTLHCAACHKLGNSGNPAGPNLSALGDKTPRSILTAILNPNEAIEDRFNAYSLTTNENSQFIGMIINEGANSITLMDLNGQQNRLLRSDIKTLFSLGRSLMPEGFEQVLNDQNLADLLALINSSSTPPKTFTGNKPTLLKESKKGKITLSAANAEIYGDSLMFEEKYKNLGFWRSSNDRAAWTIETKRAGEFDIHLNWALNGSGNNNQMQLSIGQNQIINKVSGTGSWDQYESKHIATIQLEEGKQRVTIQALQPLNEFLMDLKLLELKRNSDVK
jgi:putative heme-binding domain-containing protein